MIANLFAVLTLVAFGTAGPAALAYARPCFPRPVNQTELRDLVGEFQKMPKPSPPAPGAYTCSLVFGYGCHEIIQQDIPVKVRAVRGDDHEANLELQLAMGAPTSLTTGHWWYDRHLRAASDDQGILRFPSSNQRWGQVRADGAKMMIILTTPYLKEMYEPTPVMIGTESPARVIDAYVCRRR